jgi:hypothetical protein
MAAVGFIFDFLNVNTGAAFKNNWQVSAGFSYNPFEISNNALRGASSMRRPIGIGPNLNINSDSRKKIYGGFNMGGFSGFENTVKNRNIGLTIIFSTLRRSQYQSQWKLLL